MEKTDVLIVGAGPAGALSALFLAKKGIKSILFDKAEFPRDKICGDGISGWVLWVLAQLDPEVLKRLNRQPFLLHSYGIRVVAPNHKILELPFLDQQDHGPDVPPGYTCKRKDLDQFFIEEVKSRSLITLREKTEIIDYQQFSDGIVGKTGLGEKIKAKIIIFANGANSKFMKDPGGIKKDKKWTMTGIKTYYKGVTGLHEKNFVELHFLKDLLPGYLWIFPLPNGECNVGLGLDQKRISEKKLNLGKLLLHNIKSIPYLKKRFKHAERIAPLQAYGLPLWDKKRSISGERFMLAGDAASLVDPITGEGIGHAALSGMFAANQAERALASGDFSGESMQQYDEELFNKIEKELKISRKIPRFAGQSWLFNALVNRALKNDSLQEMLTNAMTNLEIRKQLKEPLTFVKLFLGLK